MFAPSCAACWVHLFAAAMLSVAMLICSLPNPARAATAIASFTVTMTVANICSFSSSNLDFGTYAGAQTDAIGMVTVTCNNQLAYKIGINAGANSDGTTANWNLLGPGGALVSYKIYTDSARSTYWGDQPTGTAVSGTGNGGAQVYSAYGRISAGQYMRPGAYTDMITFTLYY